MGLLESLKNRFFGQDKDDNKNDLSTTTIAINEPKILTHTHRVKLEDPMNFSRSTRIAQKELNKLATIQTQENDIKTFRKLSLIPEITSSIDEIENEAIFEDIEGDIVMINVDEEKRPDVKKLTKSIEESFDEIKEILRFDEEGSELFRRWYVDSKLTLECVYDNKDKKSGIIAAILIDPLGLREYTTKEGNKYYSYETNQNRSMRINEPSEVELKQGKYYTEEQIVEVTSGWHNSDLGYEIGYLKPAVKPINNLTTIEDMMLIYRATRAVEKRIWNINIGQMSKTQAEQYLQKTINEIKSRKLYNHETGELTGEAAVEAITEDWVFPTRGGRSDTSVDTIKGDTSFTESTEDHQIFLRKVYQAMRIPVSRLEEDSTLEFSSDDILRAEMKFTRFIEKLRRRFGKLFMEMMKRHMISKGIITEEEWNETVRPSIRLVWSNSNEIVERARLQVIRDKVEAVEDLKSAEVIPEIGHIFSKGWVLRNIFKMTESDIESMKKEIDDELEQSNGEEDADIS